MHLFRTIWTNPRAVLREVLNNRSFIMPFIILYFGSVGVGMFSLFDVQGIDLGTEMPMETIEMPLWFSIMSAVIVSPIFYFISAVIYSFFIMLFGKWLFKGVGTFKDLLKINSVSYIPFIFVIPIIGVWYIINPDPIQNMGLLGFIGVFLLGAFTFIYYFIINLVGISEAHQFSKWKAFFTMIIPTIIFLIIIFAIIATLLLVIFFIFAGLTGI